MPVLRGVVVPVLRGVVVPDRWLSIVATTVIIRTVLLPVFIYQIQATARLVVRRGSHVARSLLHRVAFHASLLPGQCLTNSARLRVAAFPPCVR